MLVLPPTIHLYGRPVQFSKMAIFNVDQANHSTEMTDRDTGTTGQVTGVFVFAAPRLLEKWTWPFSRSDDIVLAGDYCLPNVIVLLDSQSRIASLCICVAMLDLSYFEWLKHGLS